MPEPTDDGIYSVTCYCDDPTGNVADNDGLTKDGNRWKDGDGDLVTFVLVDNVSNGTLNLNSTTGEFHYQQNEGYIGNDSFTYKIDDGKGTSTTKATVTISVAGMIADATGAEVAGMFAVKGNSVASTAKGTFTPAGSATPRQSTDAEFYHSKYYNKQYDGPTEFTVDYTIKLKADGTFEPTGSTVKMTTVNYTLRKLILVRPNASVSAAQQAQWEMEGKTVLREPGNGKVYVYKAPETVASGFKTLDIKVTDATIVDGKLHSFKFVDSKWYGDLTHGVIDKGIVGEVDLKKCKVKYTAKYQDPIRGTIATYDVTGKIKK